MKPLNSDIPKCNPISSECVIWQGPDISCLSLCKGDTVSTVVYKLAVELCEIMDQLSISSYDLACLNLGTATPIDIKGLIQLLVDRICALSGTPNPSSATSSSAPTPIVQSSSSSSSSTAEPQVPIASCFYYTNQYGDQVTTMTMEQYITTIGNTICNMVQELGLSQSVIATHTTQISTIQEQQGVMQQDIDNLTPIQITPQCVLPPIPTLIDNLVIALEQQFCQLIGATGDATAIYNAIALQCSALGTAPALGGGGGNMASIPGWNNNNTNLAAAVNNIWLTLCDLRAAVTNIQANCCPTGCSGIEMLFSATIVGSSITMFITGTIPAGFLTCNPLGTPVTVTDSDGGSYYTFFNIVSAINDPLGYSIPLSGTPINASADITVTIASCLSNSATGATCESVLTDTIINSATCPAMTYNTTQGSITYDGTVIAGVATYTLELWNNAGTSMLSNQIQLLTGPAALTGTFLSLTAATNYKLRVKVTVSGVDTYCPFTLVTTLPDTCPEPDTVSADITY